MHCVFCSEIPVTHTVEIQKANIVSEYVTDFFSVFVDFTPDKVLLLENVAIELYESCQTILFVSVIGPAKLLMSKSAHEKPAIFVFRARENNFPAILKAHFLRPNVLNLCRLETSTNCPLRGAAECVVLMFDQYRHYRWVMRYLLHIEVRAILAMGDICFTQDGIQRFFKRLCVDHR